MSFEVLNIRTAQKSILFTSFADFRESQHRDHGPESSFLCLGKTFSEWHRRTLSLQNFLYELAIERGIGLLPSVRGSPAAGRREAVVLFGNLALYLSMELSRVLNQVRTVDRDCYELIAFDALRKFDFQEPFTTSDSLGMLNSKAFLDLLEALALRHHFGVQGEIKVQLTRSKQQVKRRFRVIERLYLITQIIMAPLSRRSNFFLLSTYVGRLNELRLNLSLLQVPILAEVRPSSRGWVGTEKSLFRFDDEPSLETIVGWLMEIVVPGKLTSSIEQTLTVANKLGFPKSPSVVLTANSFETDDEFKAHLAYRCSSAAYLVAQHGVGYGVSHFRASAPELEIADSFLSWGRGGTVWNSVDFGLVKPIPKLPEKRPKRSVEVFLRPDKFNFYSFADETFLTESYLDSIVELSRLLDRSNIEVALRPHSAMKSESVEYLRKRINRMHGVRILNKSRSMASLMRNGVGLIFTYDSTGMLELGVSNHSFFAFLPDGIGHVIPDYRANYEALQLGGLLSSDPSEAASLIGEWVKALTPTEGYETAVLNFIAGIARENRDKLAHLRAIVKSASRR